MRATANLQPDDFFHCGFRILEEEGSTGLTAVALCERLEVTRGSFYHHFTNFDVYIESLLEHWEDVYTRSRQESLHSETELEQRSNVFISSAVSLPHALENAMRAWANTNSVVLESVRRIDRLRVESTERSLVAAGCDEATAALYAELAIAAFVGMEARGQADDGALFRRIFVELEWAVMTRAGMEPPRRSPR